jgi:glycosyltransferase involved in cell wall biosynthesis
MKILHIYSSRTSGGAEIAMMAIVKGLQEKGFENVIVAPSGGYLFDKAKEMNLTAYPVLIKGSFDPIGFFKLLNAVNKENADILYAHQGKVFWPCIFVKWLKGSKVKVIFHRHADIPHKWYSRAHYKWADKVIAISEAVRDNLIAKENIPEEKIALVYNGLDFNVFNNTVSGDEVRKEYNIEKNPVIGTAGAMNLPKGKGQQYLIGAAKNLLLKYPQARYLIVGEGPFKERLMAMAEAAGLSGKIIFTGYKENVEKYIAAMDIFCLLSWDKEGLGQVMVEAQAMGKPVIGTNVGGIPETFNTGYTGYLIPKEDSTELTRALDILLGDEEKRKQMGKAGIDFVKDKFSVEKMINSIAKICEEIVAH